MEGRRPYDLPLLVTTVALVCGGVIMVYSASFITAQDRYHDGYYFFKRQAAYAGLGLAALLLTMRIRYTIYRRLAYVGLVGSIVLLGLTFVPSLGFAAAGVRRWVRLGPLTFQPAEIAKVALLVYMAHVLAKKGEGVQSLGRGVAPVLIVAGGVALLVLAQPDFGTAALILLLAILLLFVAGARLLHLAAVALAAVPVVYVLILRAGYRQRRLAAFLDPWGDPQGSGFQIIQSFLAFGSGGVTGAGLGNGQQKLYYLPEAHTDFIFSVIGEEMGLMGTLAVVGAFGFLAWRGVRVARHSVDRFGYFLALGITLLVSVQAVLNMAVVLGLVPTKGLPLPFMSFGGTALVTTLAAMGVLLSISARGRLGVPTCGS